jgi:hypothetical protein
MTRLGIVFWLVLVAVAGFTTFKVKYAVQDIEDQLNRVRKQTIADQQEIRVLTADWTYLNQPERLAEMNRRFLALVPITPKQLQLRIADLPFRAPAVAPDVMLAAAPDPAARQIPLDPLPVPDPVPVNENSASPAALAMASTAPDRPWADGARTEPASLPERPEDAAPVQLAKTAPVQLAKTAPVQLANAGPVGKPNSLDALIAQIADAR